MPVLARNGRDEPRTYALDIVIDFVPFGEKRQLALDLCRCLATQLNVLGKTVPVIR